MSYSPPVKAITDQGTLQRFIEGATCASFTAFLEALTRLAPTHVLAPSADRQEPPA